MADSAAFLSPLAVGLAGIGPAIGIGMLTTAFFQSVARQPEVQGSLTMFYFISLGVVELLGLLGFVAFILAKG
jgi:F-type H+-transporting ATPase subunit c